MKVTIRSIGSALLGALLLAACAGPRPPAPPPEPGLFGYVAFRGDSHEAFPQWRRVQREMERDRPVIERCDQGLPCPSRRVAAWRAKVAQLQGRPALEQMAEINRFINELVPYTEDIVAYGVDDHWAAPLEFLRFDGDCEDFAIIKYYSLLDLGFDDSQMRIIVLEDRQRDIPHAVLVVHHEGENYVLDSNFSVLVTDDKLPHYVPQFSVNGSSRWLHAPLGDDRPAVPVT